MRRTERSWGRITDTRGFAVVRLLGCPLCRAEVLQVDRQPILRHYSSPGRACDASHKTMEQAQAIRRLRLRAHP